MASIVEEIDSRASESARYSVLIVGAIGVLLGLVFWGLTILLSKFMVEPLFCQATVSSCLAATGVAGDISTIIVATIGIVIMVALKMARPLIVTVSTAVSLWGLAMLTSEFGWIEAALWSAWLYMLAYIVFSWVARYLLLKPVIVTMIVIVIMARLAVI